MVLILSVRGVLAVVAALAALLAGCGAGNDEAGGPPEVVASFFPLAEAAARVGGDAVAVDDLTPAGAEPHDLELAPAQVEAIEDAALVVVLGGGFQPAVERVAARRDGATIEVLDALGVGDDGPGDGDPHVWLDPTRMAAIVDEIAAELAALLPDDAPGIRRRAEAYARQLADLDQRFRSGLARCETRTLVVQHEAFGWLAARYELDQEGISGLVPEQEPDPRRLARLIDLVRDHDMTVVFTETLVDPAVARTLAREAGVATAVLNPLEGLTRRQRDAGETYLSQMEANLAALRDGLRCA